MKISTLKWINLLRFTLLAAVLVLVVLALVLSAQTLIVSVGWHGVASVGWVT